MPPARHERHQVAVTPSPRDRVVRCFFERDRLADGGRCVLLGLERFLNRTITEARTVFGLGVTQPLAKCSFRRGRRNLRIAVRRR
jgi:hypothetical protein